MSSLFKKPILHFFVLGACLYALTRAVAPPPAPPSVAYPSAERMTSLEREWLTSTGHTPDVATLQRLAQIELDHSMLFNEALQLNLHVLDRVVQQRLLRDMRFLGDAEDRSDVELLQQAYAMNLHANDLVVRRRLVQAMDSIYRAAGEAIEPSDADLQKIYQQRKQEFTLPARVEISHIFVSGDSYGAKAKPRAERLQKSFAEDGIKPEAALHVSDPFLSGNHFSYLSPQQLQKHFGEGFAQQAFACSVQAWCGPITSPYGQHLVWVHDREDPRLQKLSAVRDKLVYHFRRQQGDRAQAEQMKTLRSRYKVVRS